MITGGTNYEIISPEVLLNDLQYYITPPHDCSYLENKSARMVF